MVVFRFLTRSFRLYEGAECYERKRHLHSELIHEIQMKFEKSIFLYMKERKQRTYILKELMKTGRRLE